jgi:hypothetical protein
MAKKVGKGKGRTKTMKKVPPQTEGYTPKGAMFGGGSTTKDKSAAKKREKRLADVPM